MMNSPTHEQPDEQPPTAGERAPVLVVDDDKVLRDALRMWLEDAGYTVRVAADGFDALAILDQTPGAFIIVADYAMPWLDGRGLLDTVTASPELERRSAFIYMTAAERVLPRTFVGELLARGAPVLRKPFDLDALTRAVEEAQTRLRRGSRPTLPPEGGPSRGPTGGNGC
jgi:CheY-like chemotaxis protein